MSLATYRSSHDYCRQMNTADTSHRRKAAALFIYVAIAIDMLSFGMIFPVLPDLLIQFTGDTAKAAVVLGWFAMLWAAMQFFAAPILGSLSDRYGRRPVILLSCFGLGIDFIIMAMAPSLTWLFIGRLISGVTSASAATASAYIADVTPAAERARAFGIVGAVAGVSLVVGPAIGGILGSIDVRLPFWIAAAFALMNAALGYFVLPESLPAAQRTRFSFQKANPVGSARLLLSNSEMRHFSTMSFLSQLANGSISAVTAIYLVHRYEWGADKIGIVLAIFGGSIALVQGVLVGPTIRVFGERIAMLLGLLCGAGGLVCYAIAPTGMWFLAALPLTSLCGLASPAIQSAMTRNVSLGEQGQLQAATATLASICGMIAPPLYAGIFAWFISLGDPSLQGAPYLLAAFIMSMAAVLALRPSVPRSN